MCSSSDNVIDAEQKYTISSPSGRGMSVDYKSVFRWRYLAPFWRNKRKSQKIAKFGLILTPRKFFGGSPQNFETSFGYSFSRPILRISLDHVLQLWVTTLGGGGVGPPNFGPNF